MAVLSEHDRSPSGGPRERAPVGIPAGPGLRAVLSAWIAEQRRWSDGASRSPGRHAVLGALGGAAVWGATAAGLGAAAWAAGLRDLDAMTAVALVAGVPVLGLGWWLGRGAGWRVHPPPPPSLLDMVPIPAGEFLMGSEEYGDERPVHGVRLAAFEMARFPVTEADWAEVIGKGKRSRLPRVSVTWHDAVRFCNALSAREGRQPCYDGEACHPERDGYRLPTEAEWEYACRANTRTRWWWGDEEEEAGEHAWFRGNARSPQPVGAPGHANAWGLSDMAGNVWEWCQDWYGPYDDAQVVDNPTGPATGGQRVARGGSWGNDPMALRSAGRVGDDPSHSNDGLGFRCVRVPRPEP